MIIVLFLVAPSYRMIAFCMFHEKASALFTRSVYGSILALQIEHEPICSMKAIIKLAVSNVPWSGLESCQWINLGFPWEVQHLI